MADADQTQIERLKELRDSFKEAADGKGPYLHIPTDRCQDWADVLDQHIKTLESEMRWAWSYHPFGAGLMVSPRDQDDFF